MHPCFPEVILKRLHGLALVAATLTACSRAPEPRFRMTVRSPVTAIPGTAATFVPLVPASAEHPRCEDLRNLPGGMGARAVSFIFGDAPEQRIAVTLDAADAPTNYSDMRGDLNASDGRDGNLTTISINLIQGHAMVQNREEGREPVTWRLGMDDALDAANLGHPRATMRRILDTCIG